LLETGSLAFVAFLVTIDPIGLVPIFLALTGGETTAGRRRIALKGSLLGGAILLAFALLGEPGLRTLGIGLPAFRIAGGITLLLLAVEMVFEHRAQRRSSTAEQLAGEQDDAGGVAVFPLAMPLVAGPAAITTVILQVSRQGGDVAGLAAVLLALAASLAVVAASLVAASYLGRLLGPTLVTMLSRLLGLLLAALSVQFVIDGVKEAFGL
jgi:multiple antibiotic resistance protein